MGNIIIYHCAKFGAFFTKRTIPPKKLAMPLHYIGHARHQHNAGFTMTLHG